MVSNKTHRQQTYRRRLVGGPLKAARRRGFTSEGELLWETEPVIRELVGRGLRA